MEWLSARPAALVRIGLYLKIFVFGPTDYKTGYWVWKS